MHADRQRAAAASAVRLLPAPLSATAPQPVIVVPPFLKFTVPVGAAPATVAVQVTVDPTVAGLPEVVSVVVVEVGVEPLQFPDTLPVPSRRKVAVATQPAVITIGWPVPPPSAIGAIGCGDWNDAPLDVSRIGPDARSAGELGGDRLGIAACTFPREGRAGNSRCPASENRTLRYRPCRSRISLAQMFAPRIGVPPAVVNVPVS